MNAATPEFDRDLTPEAAKLVETYFARVHGALLVAAAGECEETVEDLRAAVYEQLEGGPGTAADVTRVLCELGAPEVLAAQCAENVAGSAPVPCEPRSPLHGRLLGVPYELRFPTAERVVSLWWNPLDRHVFVPTFFGLGWSINFGALAVKLGMVRPDDEDVPFAAVPEGWLMLTLALPVVIATALGALVLIYQGSLPAQVAVHYGITGPDQFGPKESAVLMPVGMTLLGLALVATTWIPRKPPLLRVGAGAFATFLATISFASYAQSVATAYRPTATGILLPGIVGTLVLTGGLLVTMSRIGHAAEMRRDLDKTKKKESVS